MTRRLLMTLSGHRTLIVILSKIGLTVLNTFVGVEPKPDDSLVTARVCHYSPLAHRGRATLVETAPSVSVEDVVANTEAELVLPEKVLQMDV